MNNVMLDLETMGSGPNAAIIAIGAVEFDREVGEMGREFYMTVDLASSVKAGGVIDPLSVLWWMVQSDAARAEFAAQGEDIRKALGGFAYWFPRGANVWGNGTNFDNVILRSACERLNIVAPWGFRDDRCFRTVRAEHPPLDTSLIPEGTAHNALEDARWQARYLIELAK